MEKQSAVILVLVAALAITVSADTTIDTDNRYAYGANIGWINFDWRSFGTPQCRES